VSIKACEGYDCAFGRNASDRGKILLKRLNKAVEKTSTALFFVDFEKCHGDYAEIRAEKKSDSKS
jgi:hypothetical protein